MNSVSSARVEAAWQLAGSGLPTFDKMDRPGGSEAASDAETEVRELEQVAREFESLFTNMMLKSMRSASRVLSEDGYFNSFETRMYEDMLDEKLSSHLSEGNSLGIAEMMVRQLVPQRGKGGPESALELVRMNQSRAGFALAQDEMLLHAPTRRAVFASPDEFTAELIPRSRQAAERLNIEPGYIVAQAALETGWGEQVMFDHRGQNSHNLFGIKAGREWQGDVLTIESLEVRDGIARQEASRFKVYDSYEAALEDYVTLLSSASRYQAVAGSASVNDFAEALHQGGYATDPQYVRKLSQVYGRVVQTRVAAAPAMGAR